MVFSEKLRVLRKTRGYTQEELAQKLNLSRQAVAKWEAGQVYPDIYNLIQLSQMMNVTVDYLVKDQECAVQPVRGGQTEVEEIMRFRLEANRNTYAAYGNGVQPTRLDSHDFHYEKGEYVYHDTYFGGERFAGEEAVWKNGRAVYAMNYMGRVLEERFSVNFLKEALRAADDKMPYRGPEYYQSGEYTYQAKVKGDFTWFQGMEEIFCNNTKVYECYFHGGVVK